MSARMRRAPFCASCRAICCPIPCPAPVTTREGLTILLWQRPKEREAGLKRVECALTADSRLHSIESDGFACRNIRYGPAQEVQLAPPLWPELPVQQRREIDPALMMEMFMAVMRLAGQTRQ